jgi:hypothetical protein
VNRAKNKSLVLSSALQISFEINLFQAKIEEFYQKHQMRQNPGNVKDIILIKMFFESDVRYYK